MMTEKDEKMPKKLEIVCMPTSIRIFRFYCAFPPSDKLLNPGKMFYIRFALIALFSSVVLVGSTMHLIKNVKDRTYNHIELDFTYIVSNLAGYGLLCSYFTKVNAAVQLYLILSDFEEFGKPINFDNTNKKFNKYAKYQYCYLESITVCILLGSNMFRGAQCRKDNAELDQHEVCGLFAYTWLPFDIDFFPVKQIYLACQLFGIHYVYMMAGLASWMVLESVEHIATRLRHVSHFFNEALKEAEQRKRREKFNFAVRYHVAVLDLESKLNQTFSVFMFTHMVMSGIIMGYGVYSYMKGKNVSTILIATGWLIGLLMDCYSGQRIQDESTLVGTALYDADWSDADDELKRDIRFVMMRCQKPMIVQATSFGIMDHPLFLAVLKATYSYVTLLSQSDL
uniref:Odorant receptor n=1 Tax=Colaphellus bowringi TaxID=561076 RepID=A0A0S3J2Q1_9CUCU|nr:odorant receptor OR24 [Colaphellus bowringi]